MSKQAVVYLLDASRSMGSQMFGEDEDDDDSNTLRERKTRFDHAKQGILEMIGDLMLQSKTNECSVIALQTKQTRHHKYQRKNNKEKENDNSSDQEEENDADYSGDEEDEDENDNEEEDIPFRHLTEYPCQGIRKPTVSLLRQIQAIEPCCCCSSSSEDDDPLAGGDFCSGILLAADALHERTHKKKYERSIVLWTDARGYDVVMDVSQMLLVIDALRSMECRLYVVGMDFVTQTVDYRMPAEAPKSNSAIEGTTTTTTQKRTKYEDEDHDSGADSDDDDEEDEEDEEELNRLVYKKPEDRERLLQSLTEKTGGTVLAAHTMQQVLQHQQGQRKPSFSTAFNLEFHLAPNLIFSGVKFSLWAATKSVESFRQEAVQMDEASATAEPNGYSTINNHAAEGRAKRITASIHSQGNDNSDEFMVRTNIYGEEMTEGVHKISSFLDPEDHNTVIPLADTTKALRYGSDILPMSEFDLEATKAQLPRPAVPTLQVLGYLPNDKVPQAYRRGPPYRIFAVERHGRNDIALKALAKALMNTNKVAIVTLTKRSGSDPVLGGLFPNSSIFMEVDDLDDTNDQHPLVFLQLPYAGDVKELPTHVFDAPPPPPQLLDDDDTGVEAARRLIQSLLLKKEASPLFPPNPFHKAWNLTRLARAMDPRVPPTSSSSLLQSMQTPAYVVHAAKPALASFRATFPILPRTKTETARKTTTAGGNRNKNQALTYTDFL